jgi:hypothetical protein
MVMQFGSLNQEKGENRLNVAVTRARERIYVISSILPHQLKTDATKNEGPRLLKAYLQYSLDVSNGHYIPVAKTGESKQQEWYLKNKLIDMFKDLPQDVQLKEDLMFADLSVIRNSKYIGVFLTDDSLYHQSVSVKESHVYKPFTLSQKHWPYRQFFSRDYWFGRDVLRENIIRFITNTDEP